MPYILPSGKYYDASDSVADGSIKVPFRPSEFHDWIVDAWVLNAQRLAQGRSADISNAIQRMIEDKAKSFRYDSIDSVAKYIGYPNKYQTEAISLASWAAACWEKAEEIELSVINGASLPTVEEAMAQMPIYA